MGRRSGSDLLPSEDDIIIRDGEPYIRLAYILMVLSSLSAVVLGYLALT